MGETTFKTCLYLNGYEFYQYDELANFLIENYEYSIKLIKDNTLLEIIKESDEGLYNELIEKTSKFNYAENSLTYIIYRLSSMTIFKTLSHKFRTTYEIAIEMKRSLPNVNPEIMLLLKDNVLSMIYWEDYIFSKNSKSKRNHDFLLSVEGNSEYEYSYYYFLILHLPQNETMKFVINNHQMDNLDDLCSYMYTNQKYIKQIVAEVKENNLVLALIASQTDINTLTNAYLSQNYLDLLCVLHELSQYDFKQFLLKKTSVWMVKNYQNYTYETSKAKKLLEEYTLVFIKEDMSFLELFSLVKYLDSLYETFISLSKSSKLVKRKASILPVASEYHLGYTFNEEIVCLSYLLDNDQVNNNTYLPENILAEEKALVIDELLHENVMLFESNENLFNYYLLYDKKRHLKLTFRLIYLFILVITILSGLILINKFNLNNIEELILKISSFISLGIITFTITLLLLDYLQLQDIYNHRKRFKKYTSKINKVKTKVIKMKYKKGKDIKIKNDNDEKVIIKSLEIVKKKVNLKFIKKHKKFNNKADKLKDKEIKSRKLELKILNKITLSIAFYSSISFINYIIFMIMDKLIIHKFITVFPIYYLIFIITNILIVFLSKKFYLKSFIFYLLSIVLTLLINFI